MTALGVDNRGVANRPGADKPGATPTHLLEGDSWHFLLRPLSCVVRGYTAIAVLAPGLRVTSSATPPAVNYTDMWRNPNESGWGPAVTHQYGVLFLA